MSRYNIGMTTKRATFALIVVFTLVAAYNIYMVPKIGYSAVPTEWSPGIDWGRYYIVGNGHLISETGSALTWQSNIIDYGAFDVLPKILFAILNLITGITDFPRDLELHALLPWAGIAFIPVLSLLAYRTLGGPKCPKYALDPYLLLLFSLFPSVSAVSVVSGNTNGSAIARALFLLMLLLMVILFSSKNNRKMLMITYFILLIAVFYFYHTWAYYLSIILCCVGCIKGIKKDIDGLSIIFTSVLIFICYSIYINTNLFNETFRISKTFINSIDLLNFISISNTMKVNPELFAYQSLSNLFSQMQFLNSALIFVISMIFIYIYLQRIKNGVSNSKEQILFWIFCGQIAIGLFLFVWDGFLGVYARIFEALTYLSILLLAYNLVYSSGYLKKFLHVIVIVIVGISIYNYVSYPEPMKMHLVESEWNDISFIGNNVPKEEIIFSDFRIGTPLVYHGQRNIVTLDSTNNAPGDTEDILYSVYYNPFRPDLILDRILCSNRYYVMLSQRQSQVYILDPCLLQFKCASTNYIERWDEQINFHKVYCSTIQLYLR